MTPFRSRPVVHQRQPRALHDPRRHPLARAAALPLDPFAEFTLNMYGTRCHRECCPTGAMDELCTEAIASAQRRRTHDQDDPDQPPLGLPGRQLGLWPTEDDENPSSTPPNPNHTNRTKHTFRQWVRYRCGCLTTTSFDDHVERPPITAERAPPAASPSSCWLSSSEGLPCSRLTPSPASRSTTHRLPPPDGVSPYGARGPRGLRPVRRVPLPQISQRLAQMVQGTHDLTIFDDPAIVQSDGTKRTPPVLRRGALRRGPRHDPRRHLPHRQPRARRRLGLVHRHHDEGRHQDRRRGLRCTPTTPTPRPPRNAMATQTPSPSPGLTDEVLPRRPPQLPSPHHRQPRQRKAHVRQPRGTHRPWDGAHPNPAQHTDIALTITNRVLSICRKVKHSPMTLTSRDTSPDTCHGAVALMLTRLQPMDQGAHSETCVTPPTRYAPPATSSPAKREAGCASTPNTPRRAATWSSPLSGCTTATTEAPAPSPPTGRAGATSYARAYAFHGEPKTPTPPNARCRHALDHIVQTFDTYLTVVYTEGRLTAPWAASSPQPS